MMVAKLLLVLMALCVQVENIRGRDGQIHKKQNKRLSNLETATIKMQNELNKITSRLDDFSEVMSKTLDTIQDGLGNEKEQHIRLEYMALETKDLIKNQNDLFQKKTELLENRIEAYLTAYKGKDCWELKTIHNVSQDGVYVVQTPDGQIRSLHCDMTTDGGGWTVFQRRGDGSVRFNNTYAEYKSFFGNLTGEFWMGNDFLNVFTRGVKQTLRVDICDWGNESRWAKYQHFSVGPSADKYRLAVEDYSGTAGDPLIRGYQGNSERIHNGQAFSAPEGDHDNWAGGDCASHYHSGWWFNHCRSADLNGPYHTETSFSGWTWYGIQWITWIERHSFKGSEMKMRPSTASSSTNKPFNCPVI